MTNIHKILGAMIAFVLISAPTAAMAQRNAPVILFIDNNKLIAESRAGQSITEQIQALAEEAQNEVRTEEAAVQAEGEALQQTRESLSEEDFAQRYQALLARAQQVGQLGQIKQAEVQQAQVRALSDLNQQLQPVVEEILDDRNATVLLERSSVVFANEDMDITEEVVRALDRQVRRIEVERVDLVAEIEAARANQ